MTAASRNPPSPASARRTSASRTTPGRTPATPRPLPVEGLRRLISRDELGAAAARLGAEVGAAHPDGVALVGVLKGSVPFVADLARALSVEVEVDFLAISAYTENTGRVRIVKDLEADIWGRDVVLVEDIVDTGLTANYVLGELRRRGPRSVDVCTLLDKSVRRLVPVPLSYVGFEIGDEFVIGYGMDFEERFRNLDEILAADLKALRGDPDAFVEALFRR